GQASISYLRGRVMIRSSRFIQIGAAVVTAAVAFAGPAHKASAATELTFWEQEFDEVQKSLDHVIDAFQKANPDVKIKRSHYKNEDLRTQYQTAAMGGGGGDMVLAPNDFAGPFSVMNIIQPVNDWAKLDRFTEAGVKAVT